MDIREAKVNRTQHNSASTFSENRKNRCSTFAITWEKCEMKRVFKISKPFREEGQGQLAKEE